MMRLKIYRTKRKTSMNYRDIIVFDFETGEEILTPVNQLRSPL